MTSRTRLNGSEILAKSLQLEGVTNIFTLVGDHVLPALDVLSDKGFRFIDTRHEAAAVHMADTWGRVTGEPGVAMYTTPGFANAIPGLASALHAESPVLSISGSAELSELGRGAMQEIDQVGMARPVTKGAWLVTDARRIPDMVAHALLVAFSGRRGPVHLTIPVDVQEQEVAEDEVSAYEPRAYGRVAPALAHPDRISEAIDLLNGAERPLIIAGTAAAYAGSGDALQTLIETARVPLMTEGDARGLVPDDHPFCFGFYEHGLNRAARLLRQADVVVLLGRKQDIIMGYAQPPTVSEDATLIQVDPQPAEVGRNRSVAVGMAGDVQEVVAQLAAEAAKRTWKELPWLDQLQAERDAYTEWLDSLAVPETPMHALYVHSALKSLLGPADGLFFDGGDFCHLGRAFYPAQRPHSWLYFSPLGLLGWALPAALAFKLAHPERRAIVVTGDGAFGFNAMELDTAVRHNLPVVVILGNDSAWGIDRQIQLQLYEKTVASDLWPSRYDQVARGLGGYGEHVEHPDELPAAVDRALKLERPALLNIDIQRAISPRAEAAIARWKSRRALPF